MHKQMIIGGICLLTDRFMKRYRMVLLIVLLGILIPTVALCPYTRPFADDLTQPEPVIRTWRETGSLLQTAKAAIDTTIGFYRSITSVFFLILLDVTPFSIFSDRLLALNALLAIILLLVSMYRLACCVRYVSKDVSKEAVHCLALTLSILMFLLMPSYFESIYWFSAAAAYVYVFAVFVFLFAAVFKAFMTEQLPTWKLIVLCIGFFCLGGGNWISNTTAIALFAGLAVLTVLLRKPKKILIIGLFLLGGYMVAVFGPGNSNRVAIVGEKAGLLFSLTSSFLSAGKYLFSDVRVWLLSLFLLPVIIYAVRRSMLSFRFPLLILGYSVCILAAAHFPVIYTNYGFMLRHNNAYHMTLVFLLPINLFYLTGWLIHRSSFRLPSWMKSRKTLALASALVLLMTGALSFSSPKISSCTLEPVQALIHWVDGHSRYYADYYDSVVQAVRDEPDGDIRIEWVVTDHMLNPYTLIKTDPTHWYNTGFARYYGNEGCTIRYAP